MVGIALDMVTVERQGCRFKALLDHPLLQQWAIEQLLVHAQRRARAAVRRHLDQGVAADFSGSDALSQLGVGSGGTAAILGG
jgi:hypothetical protein